MSMNTGAFLVIISVANAVVSSPIAAAQAVETAQVLVARQDILPGTVIKDPEKLFVPARVPKAMVRPDLILNPQELKGKVVVHFLSQGHPITQKHLWRDAPGNGPKPFELSPPIPRRRDHAYLSVEKTP